MQQELITKPMFSYRVRDCNTAEEIQTALNHYEGFLEMSELLTSCQKHNIEEIVFRLRTKRNKLEGLQKFVTLEELTPANIKRQEAIVELLQLIPQLFQYRQYSLDDNWDFVIRIFKIYLGVLKNENLSWNSSKMYNEMVKFSRCINKDEMIIYLVHEIITSGLHIPYQITKQINLMIKLVRHLRIDDNIFIKLPSTRDTELKLTGFKVL